VSHLRQRIHAVQQHIKADMYPPPHMTCLPPSPSPRPPYHPTFFVLQKPAVQPLKTSSFSVLLCVSPPPHVCMTCFLLLMYVLCFFGITVCVLVRMYVSMLYMYVSSLSLSLADIYPPPHVCMTCILLLMYV